MDGKRALYLYNRHRLSAKNRGIEWGFDFDGWFAVWDASGQLDNRGKRRGQYVMSRIGDVGPYAPGNVRIMTCGDNCRDYFSRFVRNSSTSHRSITARAHAPQAETTEATTASAG